jgi:hypothetical protein
MAVSPLEQKLFDYATTNIGLSVVLVGIIIYINYLNKE